MPFDIDAIVVTPIDTWNTVDIPIGIPVENDDGFEAAYIQARRNVVQGYYGGGNNLNWTPKELKATKDPIILADKETMDAIKSISTELIDTILGTLKESYKIRLDSIENLEYNVFIESEQSTDTRQLYQNFNTILTHYKKLISGKQISYVDKYYLGLVEECALRRYSIEHSKYKYYPRLKAKVNYGNAELLTKILSITQIGRGTVKCQ